MRKLFKFFSLLLSLSLFFALVACDGDKIELKFTSEEVTIRVDQEYELDYTLVGENVTLEWSSTDTTIVTVVDGKIKGLKEGQATVKVKVKDKDIEASILVKVEPKPVVYPTSVIISGNPFQAKVGEIVQLTANVLPATASQEVEWSSSNTNVATVDATGKVTFVGIGEVTITATSKVKNEIKGEINVTVLAPDPTEIVVTTESGVNTVHLYGSVKMIASVNPDLAVKTVQWSVSDTSKATISSSGELIALAVGKVTVTATSTVNSSIKGTMEIEIIIPKPTVINVTVPYNTIQVDEEMQISFSVYPEVADRSMLYSSSNESVATVSTNGVIKGVGAGEAVITVKSAVDENVTTTINVKVIEKIGEPTHANIIVDASLTTAGRFEKITVGELDYYFGVNAFSDFTNFALQDNSVIIVYPGTYTGNTLINKNNVVIYSTVNKDKDPNTTSFDLTKQAILKGKISLADGVEGVTINGLSFTETGKVENLGVVKDFTFKNNYFFNTVKATINWSALRDYNLVGALTLWKQSKPVENILIENNKFYNVSETNIMIGNTRNIIIRNNTFTNFERDAIRVDGGYNYSKTLIEGNKFINDELDGYNGVYFRAVGADTASYANGNINHIEVRNNYFKNIGKDVLLSGAISSNTYQEFGAKIEIHHNTFDSCLNYILLRNNATAENHAQYKWEGSINYNIFLGIPSKYYFNNKNDADTETTNPPQVNMDYNFFGDLDKNPVDLEDAEIASKFKGVASLKYTYVSIEAMNAIFVNHEWAGKNENDEVFYEGMKFIFGVNAYATIKDAYEAALANATIIVLPGTYAEELEITSKPVKFETLNSKVSPVVDDSNYKLDSEKAVIITGVWYLNKVSNVSIKGFTFTDNARIRQYGATADGDSRNFLFENNLVTNTSAATIAWKQEAYATYGTTEKNNTTIPGFISLAPNGIWIHDTKILGNKFVNVSDTHILLLSVRNATIAGNEFLGGDRDAIRFDYSSTHGHFDIYDNKFENLKYNGIYVRSYAFTYEGPAFFNIERNTFKNIGEASQTVTPSSTRIGAISTAFFSESNSATFNIRFNTFIDNYNYITLRVNVNPTTWPPKGYEWKAYIMYNAFIDADGVDYYYRNIVGQNDTTVTNLNNILIDHNFYGTDEDTKAVIETAQFDHHLVDESNKTVYDTLSDLLEAIAEYYDFIKPIVVDHKLAEVEDGTIVKYFDTDLEVGKHAFASLKAAVEAAVSGKTIYVMPGEYTEDSITINVNDLNIYGPNKDINPITGTRTDEALIYAVITIGEGVKNVTINGFSFLYHHLKSYIVGSDKGKIDGFTFAYNIFDIASDALPGGGEAPIRFKQPSAEAGIKNFAFLYNYIKNTRDDRGIRIAYIENLTIIGNKLENVNDAIRANDNGGSVTGKLVVKDNIFLNTRQYAIFTAATTLKEVEIIGNLFDGTGQSYTSGAISLRQITPDAEGTTIVIKDNIFKRTKDTDIEVVHKATAETNISIVVENNEFHTTTSTIYTNRETTAVSKTIFKSNNKIFDENGNEIAHHTLVGTRIKNATVESQPE